MVFGTICIYFLFVDQILSNAILKAELDNISSGINLTFDLWLNQLSNVLLDEEWTCVCAWVDQYRSFDRSPLMCICVICSCICVILNSDYQCIYSAQIDTLVCICTPWGIKARYFTEWCSISVIDIFDELLRYSTVKCFLLLKCTSILSDGPGVSKGNTSMILIAYWHQC